MRKRLLCLLLTCSLALNSVAQDSRKGIKFFKGTGRLCSLRQRRGTCLYSWMFIPTGVVLVNVWKMRYS